MKILFAAVFVASVTFLVVSAAQGLRGLIVEWRRRWKEVGK